MNGIQIIEGDDIKKEIDRRMDSIRMKIEMDKMRMRDSLQKAKKEIQQKIEDYFPKTRSIDLVYFDAFGPSAQADMWNVNVLEKMADLLVPGGLFVTYCAKGQLKRDLKSLGFTVESLPGPPGKREMTRAWKYK